MLNQDNIAIRHVLFNWSLKELVSLRQDSNYLMGVSQQRLYAQKSSYQAKRRWCRNKAFQLQVYLDQDDQWVHEWEYQDLLHQDNQLDLEVDHQE